MSAFDPKFVEYVEKNASLLLNMTPDLKPEDMPKQKLDNEHFIRSLTKNILPRTDKTVILAVFEL